MNGWDGGWDGGDGRAVERKARDFCCSFCLCVFEFIFRSEWFVDDLLFFCGHVIFGKHCCQKCVRIQIQPHQVSRYVLDIF